ncbi:hypothetical protein EWI61_02930 [Methylolobus aquaticus]|nr:hypothetical protein EWI61_02930 [Methylolobus aquaticus]
MHLFKYLAREHLRAFLSRGTVRIGTLYEYRQIEKFGAVVGDVNEGSHQTELSVPGGAEIDLSTNSSEAEFFRTHVLSPELQDAKVKFILQDGAKLIVNSNSQNLYIYCVTHEFSAEVMKEFGCDSCLEIVNPDGFFAALSKRIRHKATFNSYGPITYANKYTHYTNPHERHPAAVKSPEYGYQKEWRAIWIPVKPPRKSLIIDAPRAIHYCRPYKPS